MKTETSKTIVNIIGISGLVMLLLISLYNIASNELCKANEEYCNDRLLCFHHDKGCETVFPEYYELNTDGTYSRKVYEPTKPRRSNDSHVGYGPRFNITKGVIDNGLNIDGIGF